MSQTVISFVKKKKKEVGEEVEEGEGNSVTAW